MKADDYQIGYGKPPKNTRFAKGSSGNPRGRPKGSLSLRSILQKASAERIPVVINGRKRTISKLEAVVTQVLNRAANGDHKAAQMVLQLTSSLGVDEPTSSSIPTVSPATRASLMKTIAERFQESGDNEPRT